MERTCELIKQAKEGNKKAKQIKKMLREPSKFLATIQIGITLAGFLSSAFAADAFADDLAPSETVQLDKEKVLSFVTVHGSSNSHTAILAKTMNIPSVINCPVEIDSDIDGAFAFLISGRVILYPLKAFTLQKRTYIFQ